MPRISLKQLFFVAISIKLVIVLFMLGLFYIKQHSVAQIANRPNSFLYAFYLQDGNNYLSICNTGYIKPYAQDYKDSISYLAFLPGLPLVLCGVKYFPANIDMNWYNGLVINLIGWLLLLIALRYYLDKYYSDDELKNYLMFFYVMFPMSFFFHLNYIEVLFVPLLLFIWRLVDDNKIKTMAILAFLLSFVRITAVPVGLMMWLKYNYNYIHSSSENKNLKQYLFNSSLFGTFLAGSLLTFGYFQQQFGSFWMFFESQSLTYGRVGGISGITKSWTEITGIKPTYWDSVDFSQIINNTGFEFYNRDFRLLHLYWLPILFALFASFLLIRQKRWFELFFCWVMWLIPMSSDSNSINRYLLQSFPFVLVVGESCYANKWIRYPALIISGCLFLLYFILHCYGLWIG